MLIILHHIFAPVPTASVISNRQLSPLERFMGSEARIISSGDLAVSNYIKAEWRSIYLPEDDQREDRGMLYLFPIDNGKFCLQLCYLQYEDTSAENATVYSVSFLPSFFDQYPAEALMANQPFRF